MLEILSRVTIGSDEIFNVLLAAFSDDESKFPCARLISLLTATNAPYPYF